MTSFAPVRTWNGSEWVSTYPDLSRGLIARWPFGPTNELNDLALDTSTRGANHGDVSAEVENGSDSPVGESYYFDGTDGDVSHDPIDFSDTDPHTFSLWYRLVGSKDDYILPFGNVNENSSTIYFSTNDGTAGPQFRFRSKNTNNKIAEPHGWFDGEWHSLTWRVSPDRTVEIFDNGGLVDSKVVGDTGFIYNNIGNGYGNESYTALGEFSDIRIYDRRLSDVEIAALYGRGGLS